MRILTTRLVLIWALAFSCILAWKAADIIRATAEVMK